MDKAASGIGVLFYRLMGRAVFAEAVRIVGGRPAQEHGLSGRLRYRLETRCDPKSLKLHDYSNSHSGPVRLISLAAMPGD